MLGGEEGGGEDPLEPPVGVVLPVSELEPRGLEPESVLRPDC